MFIWLSHFSVIQTKNSAKQKKLLFEQNCPLKVQNEQVKCAPIRFGFVVSTKFSLIRTNGHAGWSALQFVKITDILLPKTTKSVMFRNE